MESFRSDTVEFANANDTISVALETGEQQLSHRPAVTTHGTVETHPVKVVIYTCGSDVFFQPVCPRDFIGMTDNGPRPVAPAIDEWRTFTGDHVWEPFYRVWVGLPGFEYRQLGARPL